MTIKVMRVALSSLITLMICVVPVAAHPLTLEERVRAQAAIESVYYSHQLGATRTFEQAVPREVLERKVRTYLKQSLALEKFWNIQVTEEMLRKELERMARQTRMPDRLRELYSALGNDPVIIQECLARPALVNRLSRSFFAHDLRTQAEAHQTAERLRDRLLVGQVDALAEQSNRAVVDYLRLDPTGAGIGPGVKSRSGAHREGDLGAPVVELSTNEFEHVSSLVPKRPGEIGPIDEDDAKFLIRVALERQPDSLRVATFTVEKRSWDVWWREVVLRLDEGSVAAVASPAFALPIPASGPGCTNDTWSNGSLDDTPLPRKWHTAVWTGSRMIIWSGDAAWSTGALYDPATDTWAPTSTTNQPQGRIQHVAVWTGSQMLVWGGSSGAYLNTGGRYDPMADQWTPITTAGAPSPRISHTAVWTGKEMVIWGGATDAGSSNTGGRYDPVADSWKPTSTLAAPSPRGYGHSAVWTGNLMVVWGGSADGTGGRYDPATDLWAATSSLNAPAGRANHTAIWTGSEMLVWGGNSVDNTLLYNSGGRYNPGTDSWAPTSTVNAPAARSHATVIWTGSVMVVWGGYTPASNLSTGGRYDPKIDTWSATSALNAPAGRNSHTAIWTGSLMVVWGGWNQSVFFNTGGRYDPAGDAWTPTSTGGAPSGRSDHQAVWTGSVMIVWGGSAGSSGGRYDPATDSWTPTSTANAPPAHGGYSAIWSGSEMIVWGGTNLGGTVFYNNGGRYDPISDTWRSTSTQNAPVPRTTHTAVWTGRFMVVWGGYYYITPPLGRYFYLNTGGRYDPATDTWVATSLLDAPVGRSGATSVWTGNVVVVWGGYGDNGVIPNVGGRYDPAADAWTPTTATNAPAGRTRHTAVWTGSRMIVWGGDGALPTGGRYDPVGDSWAPTSLLGAPTVVGGHVAVWTGSEMVVWGTDGHSSQSGGRYDPSADAWAPISMTDAPPGIYGMTAVWIGDSMLVWGGNANYPGVNFNTGGRYCACANNAYYLDGDGDGFGDPGVSIQSCGEVIGYVRTGGDCDDADPGVWGTPSEARELLLLDPVTISWQPPASPGAVHVLYDLIRSDNPTDFIAGALCVVSDSPDLSATDAEIPAPGRIFAYLVRGQDGCLDGQGPLGNDSSGTSRIGRTCP